MSKKTYKKAMKKAVRFVKDTYGDGLISLDRDVFSVNPRASRAPAIRKICAITEENLKILRGDLYRVR